MPSNHAFHHLHRRKRHYQNLEPYPHPNKWKRLLDKLIYLAIFISPAMTIPQITRIWLEKNASSISLAAWLTYTLVAGLWLIYSIAHKEKPLIIASSLNIVVNFLVYLGAVIYS